MPPEVKQACFSFRGSAFELQLTSFENAVWLHLHDAPTADAQHKLSLPNLGSVNVVTPGNPPAHSVLLDETVSDPTNEAGSEGSTDSLQAVFGSRLAQHLQRKLNKEDSQHQKRIVYVACGVTNPSSTLLMKNDIEFSQVVVKEALSLSIALPVHTLE